MDFERSQFGKMQLWIVDHFHLHKKVPVLMNHNIWKIVCYDLLLQVPFCEDESFQLFRVAFFRRDFFQNPYFNHQFGFYQFSIKFHWNVKLTASPEIVAFRGNFDLQNEEIISYKNSLSCVAHFLRNSMTYLLQTRV